MIIFDYLWVLDNLWSMDPWPPEYIPVSLALSSQALAWTIQLAFSEAPHRARLSSGTLQTSRERRNPARLTRARRVWQSVASGIPLGWSIVQPTWPCKIARGKLKQGAIPMLGYQGISMALRSGDDPSPIAGKIPRTRQDIVRIITSGRAERVSGTSPRLGKSCKIFSRNWEYWISLF